MAKPAIVVRGRPVAWHRRLFYGCGGSTAVSGASGSDITADSGAAGATSSADYRGPVLRNAIHILANLEQFDQQLALDQVVDRLNQWVHLQKFDVDWKARSVHGQHAAEAVCRQPVGRSIAGRMFNHEMDGEFLKEAVWLRDISNANRGDKLDDLSMAEHLFDWTIRNIQLVDRASGSAKTGPKDRRHHAADSRPAFHRATCCCYGRGTAEQRAWIFILLARQQDLDVGDARHARSGSSG